MRTALIAICMLVATSSLDPAHSQTLYAFLVVDTKAGQAFRVNLQKLDDLLGEIDELMHVERRSAVGGQFNCRTIDSLLNKNAITKNDAVLFYYSGLGFRSSGKFPEFDCRRSWQDRNRVGLADVVAHFTKGKEKPRLVVAIADTHNEKLSRRPPSFAMSDEAIRKFHDPGSPRQQLLKKLFRDSRGVYTITAAKAGQDAHFITRSNDDAPIGGYFTNQFLEALDNWSKQDPKIATWKRVLAMAARPIPPREEPLQTPYVEIQEPKE